MSTNKTKGTNMTTITLENGRMFPVFDGEILSWEF
jgi:hypothetical protein